MCMSLSFLLRISSTILNNLHELHDERAHHACIGYTYTSRVDWLHIKFYSNNKSNRCNSTKYRNHLNLNTFCSLTLYTCRCTIWAMLPFHWCNRAREMDFKSLWLKWWWLLITVIFFFSFFFCRHRFTSANTGLQMFNSCIAFNFSIY